MYKRLIPVLFFILTVTSCNNTVVYTPIKVNEQYSLIVPDFLQQCTDLHKAASLQLQNTERDLYMVVIDEKKSVIDGVGLHYDLQSYFNEVVKQPFISEIQHVVSDTPPKQITIGTNKALLFSVSGLTGKVKVHYRLAIVETPDCFYQLILWTREGNISQLEPEMLKIIHSFKVGV